MKPLYSLLAVLFCCFYTIHATTINGRFIVINTDGTTASALLQLNTNTGTDDMGGATIVFSFDTSAVYINENPVDGVDYIFHNFSGGNYSLATVTRPMKNKIWINIDLPNINNNNGTVVSASPAWTNVVTINFQVRDPLAQKNLSWMTSSFFWGIYDADNSTLWETGVFTDFPTSVEPISDIPQDFILEQNYPNPFNPSTRIRYSIPVSLNSNQAASFVSLKVFDILGNLVATLVNENKEPGTYEVEFKIDNSLSNLSSGIYIYRMESAGYMDTRKMVLLK